MASASGEDAPGVGIRLVDAPLETQDDPRARLYIVDHVAPGEEIERIEVSNDTGTESQVEVYPGAADVRDGSFVGLAADDQLSHGPWSMTVTLTSGLLTKTAQATLTSPGTVGSGETVRVDPGVPAAW